MVCRLCLQNSSEVLEIFNYKGQELKIATVIGKHFWFEPESEDPVSSHICHCCWTKVSDFHEFYKYVEKAQQLLTVEVIVKTEYNLTACDVTVQDVELASKHEHNIEEQYEESFNITSDVLTEDDFEFPPDFKDEFIDIVNNEKKNDDQDIFAMHDNKEDESDLQFQIKKKKKILRKKGTKIKRSSKRNKVEFLTEETTTTHKGRGRPRKVEVPPLKNKSNCNEEKAAQEMSEIINYQSEDSQIFQCPQCPEKFSRKYLLQTHKTRQHNNELKYFCKECKKGFFVKSDLTSHVALRHGTKCESKYVCNICNKSYTRASGLKEHMSKHTGLPLYRCPHCNRTFNHMSNMHLHRKTKHPKEFEEFRKLIKISDHRKEIVIPTISSLSDATKNSGELPSKHGLEENIEEQYEEPFNIPSETIRENLNTQRMSDIINHKISEYMQLKCDVCGLEFDTFGHIANHMRSVHDVNPYVKCCEKKFFRRASLYHHIMFHLNPDIYKCEKCDKVFSDKRSFTNHNLSMHQSEDSKIFQCSQCPQKYDRNYLLQHHETWHRNNQECKTGSGLTSYTASGHGTKGDVCSEVVKRPITSERDQLKHQRILEKKVQCDLCDTWLKNKSNLARHKRRHAFQEQPQVCTVCQKTYPNRPALYYHKRYVHESNGKYECNICKISYKLPTSLKEHMSQHTGLSLYRCPHCSRMFNRKSNMHHHRKRMHPKEFEEFRKLRKISARSKEPIIPTMSSLSDATKNPGDFVPFSSSVLALIKE